MTELHSQSATAALPDTPEGCRARLATLQSEIAAAKAEDRFVDANHPDYWLMVADAKAAIERATVRSKRWSANGTCTPITEPPSEPIPAPEWKTGGTAVKLGPWDRFKA